jgi:hypothetical protein
MDASVVLFAYESVDVVVVDVVVDEKERGQEGRRTFWIGSRSRICRPLNLLRTDLPLHLLQT